MNQDQMQKSSDQLRIKIKKIWGRLSDDDIALAEMQKDRFFGKLQETYGFTKADAQRRFNTLEKSCADKSL